MGKRPKRNSGRIYCSTIGHKVGGQARTRGGRVSRDKRWGACSAKVGDTRWQLVGRVNGKLDAVEQTITYTITVVWAPLSKCSHFNTARDLAKISLCDHFYLLARFPLSFSYMHLTPQSHHHHHNLTSVFSTNPSTYVLFTFLLLLLMTSMQWLDCMHAHLGLNCKSQPFIIGPHLLHLSPGLLSSTVPAFPRIIQVNS